MNFTIFGDLLSAGSYLLFIRLAKPVELSFGRFMGGQAIPLRKGCYLYVGSALGAGIRSFPLASRLLRHASRSGGLRPHEIQRELLEFFKEKGFDSKRKTSGKKLHWHIDYLLDLPASELFHIVMVMSPLRLEHQLAELVGSMPEVTAVAERLGAQDAKSGSHLFFVRKPKRVMNRLEETLPQMLPPEAENRDA